MEPGPSSARPQAIPLAEGYQPKKKKQRVKSNVVWSQPQDQGMGKHASTQLFFILDTLKKRNGPISFSELSIMTGQILEKDPDLLSRFEAHERVIKNPINGLYTFAFEHEAVASRDDLLKEIKTHSRRGGGLSVASLKQRWNGAPAVVEQLENDGLVLVTRASKDGQPGVPKMVFWNDIQRSEGGQQIDQEFLTMWQDLKFPPEADLQKALLHLGQTPARTSAAPLRAGIGQKKKGRRGPRPRHQKWQNTHTGIDLSKDYVPPSAADVKK